MSTASWARTKTFLSTLPVRGATGTNPGDVRNNPISIHAPREGSDYNPSLKVLPRMRFLSTLPVRGATPAH